VAERALERGEADELADVLCREVRDQVERRHAHALGLRAHAEEGIAQARAYVTAMLDLQVWAHGVHRQVVADPHAHLEGHAHG
jgi:hypothetical protein